MNHNEEAQPVVLTPAELRAVEVNKYYMSEKRGSEVPIEEAIADFRQGHAHDWRGDKLRQDNEAQIREMQKHKYLRSMEAGHDLGEAAAHEWASHYASVWRQERESLERNGFVVTTLEVEIPAGHSCPISELAAVSRQYDADAYMHADGMCFENFTLDGKPFIHARAIAGKLELGPGQRARFEFIASGRQARELLDAVAETVRRMARGANEVAVSLSAVSGHTGDG